VSGEERVTEVAGCLGIDPASLERLLRDVERIGAVHLRAGIPRLLPRQCEPHQCPAAGAAPATTVPPWASATCLTIASPRPEPAAPRASRAR
jgi:hypothetical protein